MATYFKLVLKNCERHFEREVISEDIVTAIQDFHLGVSAYTPKTTAEDGTTVSFALIGVDGHGDYISRVFLKGIGRHGGIKRAPTTLQEIATELGVDVKELEEDNWVGESEEWTSLR